ncbi:MAG: hypothetical protein SFY95_05935 [Planctomycetota bacterium]|nr:hypothetical protein [Planctomycetota bacterium]
MPRKGGRNRGPNDRKGRKGPGDERPRTPEDRINNRAKSRPKASPTRASRAESKRAKSNRPEPKRRRRKPELVLRRMRPIAHRGGRRERANRRMIVIER